MTSRTRHPRGRLLAILTSLAVVAGLFLASPADAVSQTQTRRLSGNTRYDTAAAAAKDAYPNAANAVLATGEDFADALAASGLAGALDAPLLLTPSNSLHNATDAALRTLKTATVYLMGGEKAIDANVEAALKNQGYTIKRIQGATRFDTAAKAGAEIAATAKGVGTTSSGKTAIVINAFTFPDAVSSSAVAYARGFPVLLTETSSVPKATTDALASLSIDHVIVVGGTASVSDEVVAELQKTYTVQRLAGTTRYSTNQAVVTYATDELGFGGPLAFLATGEAPWDAMAGGAPAGSTKSPLLLTPTSKLGDEAKTFLSERANDYDQIAALGGTNAVSAAALNEAGTAATKTSNQNIDVSPSAVAALGLSEAPKSEPENTLDPPSKAGERTYTVNGLSPGVEYSIALIEPSTVTSAAGAKTTFSSYTRVTGTTASIETVNGTAVAAAGGGSEATYAEAKPNSSGQLTFRIDSTQVDSTIPLVFVDTDSDNALDLESGIPTESFGLGGRTDWRPAAAANGTYTGVVVKTVDLTNNYFVDTADRSFLYSSGDTYKVNGSTISFAAFENLLTIRDSLDITYSNTVASTFDVKVDDIPDISLEPRAALLDANTVKITWTASTQPDAVYAVHFDDDKDNTIDRNGNVIVESLASPEASTVTRTITLTAAQKADIAAGNKISWFVVPRGGTSKAEDTTTDAGAAHEFQTNLVPDILTRTNGLTVSFDAGSNAKLTAGDVLEMHFNEGVALGSTRTLRLTDGTSSHIVKGDGVESAWAVVNGSTVSITILKDLPNATTPLPYSLTVQADATHPGVQGIVLASDSTVAVTMGNLSDTVFENNGPELMVETSTCKVGATTCKITFNEPVDKASAETEANWTYDDTTPAPPTPNPLDPSAPTTATLSTVVLGADKREVTLTFSNPLSANDTISPVGASVAVADDDGQTSTQAAFDFVT